MLKTLNDVFEKLDKLNDIDNLMYVDCKAHSFINIDWYKAILEKVKIHNPKRVIDVGSNLNQFGFLFENENIEYIGIDRNTTIPSDYGIMQPYIGEKVKYIQARYEDISDYFKNDIIISCLCVGYLVNIKDIKGKYLIVNDFDNKGECSAKQIDLVEKVEEVE